MDRPIFLATRGSALALAQTHMVLKACRHAFPHEQFEIKIIRTTGDKLQSAPPDLPAMPGTKGLFTKELEVALLNGEADLAVHSLKDLPTDLPTGLALRATLPRADVRDVLIFRAATRSMLETSGAGGNVTGLRDFPGGATIATSSTRRQAQIQALRPDLKVTPIRGNVGTRLHKLSEQANLDGLVLAAAGLHRLQFQIGADGQLAGPDKPGEKDPVPKGLRAIYLPVEQMVPCVGQGAIGLEGRADQKDRMTEIFNHLNDQATFACVTAERAFLHAMGGGCLSPVAAYAALTGTKLCLRAVSFREERVRRTERSGPIGEAQQLGELAADDVRA